MSSAFVSSLISFCYNSPLHAFLIFTMLSIMYVLWMGDTSLHRHGPVGRLQRAIVNFEWCACALIGNANAHAGGGVGVGGGKKKAVMNWFASTIVGRALGAMKHYLLNRPNHVFQVMYSFLLIGGFMSWILLTWDYLPFIHKIGSHISVWSTFILFLFSCNVDPGFINKSTVDRYAKVYPYDHVFYQEDKECITCKVKKPARSKHCSVCNTCVHRFDHHCPWINSCVGARNLPFFIGFTFMTAVTCFYGAVLMSKIVYYDVIVHYRIFEVIYLPKFQDYGSPYSIFVELLLYYVGPLFIVQCLFMYVTAATLFVFTSYHIYLIWRNTTTNETFKWSDFKKIIRAYESRRAVKVAKNEKILTLDEYLKINKPGNSEKTGLEANSQEESDAAVEDLRGEFYIVNSRGRIKHVNKYDNGLKANLAEVFCPIYWEILMANKKQK